MVEDLEGNTYPCFVYIGEQENSEICSIQIKNNIKLQAEIIL